MSGESSNENVELSGEQLPPPTEERQMWIKRLWLWLFGHPKSVVPLRDGCKMTRSEFEQVLIQRKSELGKKPDPELRRKAEEERLEGLRQIANMNCKSGVGPLDLLPEEIWLAILKKLTPEDRLNLCHVHQAFRNLLKSTLIRDTLLPLVLDHKIRLIKMSRRVKAIQGYPYLCDIPRPYYDCPQKEDLKQLTNLRLVSKALRDAIDKYFEDRLLYVMQNPKAQDGRDALNTVEMNLWENRSNLLEAGWPQRFILRSLSVDFTVDGERLMDEPLDNLDLRLRVLKVTLDELLDSVGDQLRHFHIRIDGFDYECTGNPLAPWQYIQQLSSIIRAWLMEMPNLKWLVIEAPYLDGLRRAMNGPMPRLEELERFDVDGADMIPIANAIVSANPNIKIHSRSPSYHNGTIQYFSPPVLALPLECVHFRSTRLIMPQPVPDHNWNLKRIELRMSGAWYDTEIIHSMDNIFRFIQKFPALEDVGIRVNCVRIGEEINFLRLPNLKDFAIEFGPAVEYSGECGLFFSLQFLLHCKNLRKLKWYNRMQDSRPIRNFMDNVGEREGIWMDFLEEHENVNEANVWDVFPHLKYIRVCYGRREVWEGREASVGYEWGYGRIPRAAKRDNEFWSILWVVLAIWSLFFF